MLNRAAVPGWSALLITAAVCGAQPADFTPPELEGVGITEHLDAQLPLDLAFVDERGRAVTLGDYFDGKRPVLLTLNYYRCPMLCTLQLNGLVDALRRVAWSAGEQFEMVTVSFDPAETPSLARAKKQTYVEEYGRPSAVKGWHFLTGKQASIKALTETVGFGYRWNPDSQQWIHAAAVYMCTPDGRLSRYLYGVMYEPNTLRLAMVEASEGKIGSTLDRIILYCFHYDDEAGKYSLAAVKVMRIGGALTAIILGTALMSFWLRGRRRRALPVSSSSATPGDSTNG